MRVPPNSSNDPFAPSGYSEGARVSGSLQAQLQRSLGWLEAGSGSALFVLVEKLARKDMPKAAKDAAPAAAPHPAPTGGGH